MRRPYLMVRRRPGWSDPDRPLRIALLVGTVIGVLIGGATAPWGIFLK